MTKHIDQQSDTRFQEAVFVFKYEVTVSVTMVSYALKQTCSQSPWPSQTEITVCLAQQVPNISHCGPLSP